MSQRLWTLVIVALAVCVAAGTAAAQSTWTGGSAVDSNWTTGDNWQGGVAPSSGTTTELIFTGTTRLDPVQDTEAGFTVNSMTFDASAGAFVLGGTRPLGTTTVYQVPTTIKIGGTDAKIVKSTTEDVTITNLIEPTSSILTVQVDSGTLRTHQISGSTSRKVVKTGAGTLLVAVDPDGYYSWKSNVGPRWQVDEGVLDIRVVTSNFYKSSTGDFYRTTQVQAGYGMVVGDGLGGEKADVVRITGDMANPPSGTVVTPSGWLDLTDGTEDFFTNITIDGTMTLGSSRTVFRNGYTTHMAGGTLEMGSSSWIYAGRTISVTDGGDGRGARITGSSVRCPGSASAILTFTVADVAGADPDLLVEPQLNFDTTSPLVKDGAGVMRMTGMNSDCGPLDLNEGELILDGSITTDTVTVAGGATLRGSGQISLRSNTALQVMGGGLFDPGGSVGTFTVAGAGGTVVLGEDGSASPARLAIEVAADGTHDQVPVGGAVMLTGLAGTGLSVVEVDSDPAFLPSGSEKLFILSGGSAVTGTLANAIAYGRLELGYLLRGQASYEGDALTDSLTGGHDVVLHALERPAGGDANWDYKVSYLDLGILATNYGKTNMAWADGEFTGDTVVNYLDLGILATNYGWEAGGGGAAGEVPEPASAALILVGASLLAFLRRNRR